MALGPKTLRGKVILRVNLLDNSQKTLLVEPISTVQVSPHARTRNTSGGACDAGHARAPSPRPRPRPQDVVRMMADKCNFANPSDDCLCFSLHECLDGVTSALACAGGGAAGMTLLV